MSEGREPPRQSGLSDGREPPPPCQLSDGRVPPPLRHRLRARFRKADDLRFIGHRDLLRTMERLLRRAGLRLSMSEGFHPKPRMNFPSPLAVGITGLNEICEVELAEAVSAGEFLQAVRSQAPSGLEFTQAEVVAPGTAKARVVRVRLTFPVPPHREPALRTQIPVFLAADSFRVARAEGEEPLELRPLVENLRLSDGLLEMVLRVTPERGIRPREVLAALALTDLEAEGSSLTRTAVELAERPKEDA